MTSTEIHDFLISRPSKPAMRLLLKEEFGVSTWNPSLASLEATLLDLMVAARKGEG